LVACVSLGLWIGVALAGKMVGIYGDDLRKEGEPFELVLSSHTSQRAGRATGRSSQVRDFRRVTAGPQIVLSSKR
jgi:hypothetical protein